MLGEKGLEARCHLRSANNVVLVVYLNEKLQKLVSESGRVSKEKVESI